MISDSAAAIPVSHLWRVAGEALTTMLPDAPGFEATHSPGHWIVLGGEPSALFNWLVIHSPHPDNEARLRAGVAAIRARQASALILIPEALATGLAPVALELGLESPQPLPLMLLRPIRPETRPSPLGLVVERVQDERGLRVSTDIAAAAYGESATSFARCCGPSLLEEPALWLYLARAGSDALCICWIWRDGPLAYVGSMATSPAHQQRGAGRAILTHALAEHAATGATAVFLTASTAGRALYEQLGFRTVDTATVWTLSSAHLD
jgi:GNAT superfamily N-acetyltransferase